MVIEKIMAVLLFTFSASFFASMPFLLLKFVGQRSYGGFGNLPSI
jgi:hypothetical protein